MITVRRELSAAWKGWLGLVKSKSDPTDLHPHLARFSSDHQADHGYIKAVLGSLARGEALVAAATAWEQPHIGGNRRTNADRARGDQWRLVMAYGGLETLIKTLLCFTGRGLGPAEFGAFVLHAAPSPVSGTKVRRGRRELEDWLSRPSTSAANPIIEFLGLERGDAAIIERWIVTGDDITTWEDELRLAKALRNATAHGALTPSRAVKWGIVEAFEVLTLDIGRAATAAIQRLASNP